MPVARRARSFVWLNQFADQFIPILALVALRVVVGVGDAVLKRFSKPKKGAMQARLLARTHVSVFLQKYGLVQTACENWSCSVPKAVGMLCMPCSLVQRAVSACVKGAAPSS